MFAFEVNTLRESAERAPHRLRYRITKIARAESILRVDTQREWSEAVSKAKDARMV
jgi:hypothetical protein